MSDSLVAEVKTAQRLVLLNEAMDENSRMLFAAIEDMHKLHNVEQYNMDIVEKDHERSPNVTNLFKTA